MRQVQLLNAAKVKSGKRKNSMKLLLERWNRFLKENLDKQDVEELLSDFEVNNQDVMSRGTIAYNTLKIDQDSATVEFICEIGHPDYKLRAADIQYVQDKFMQEYGNKINEYEVSPTFIKPEYRDDFIIEYRIPIQIYNGSIQENIREKISDIDSFEEEVVELFIDENPQMFGSSRQRELPLDEDHNMDTSVMQEIIKKELIKILQEEWSKSERNKRKSKCSNPKGFTMKQFCKNQRTRSKKGEKTNEGLEERKLGKPSSETNLGDWFKRKGAPGKTGGWVDCNTCRDGKCKPCGRQEGEKRGKYPRCRPTPSQCKGYKRRGDNLQKEE